MKTLNQKESQIAISEFRQWAATLKMSSSPIPMERSMAETIGRMAPTFLAEIARVAMCEHSAQDALRILSEWKDASMGLAEFPDEPVRRRAYPINPVAGFIAQSWERLAARAFTGREVGAELRLADFESVGPALMGLAIEIEGLIEIDCPRGAISRQEAVDKGICHAMKSLGKTRKKSVPSHRLARAWVACGANPNALMPFGVYVRGSSNNRQGRPLIEGMLAMGSWRAAEALAREGAQVSEQGAPVLAACIHEALALAGKSLGDRESRIAAACLLGSSMEAGLGSFRTGKGLDFSSMALRACILARDVKNVSLFEAQGIVWSDKALSMIPSLLDQASLLDTDFVSRDYLRECLDGFYAKGGMPARDWLAVVAKVSGELGGNEAEAWLPSFEKWSSASRLPAHLVRDGILEIQKKVGANNLVVKGVDLAGAWLARVESKEMEEAAKAPRPAARRSPFAKTL